MKVLWALMRVVWFFRAWRLAGWRYAMKRPNHGTEIVFDPESEEGDRR